MFQHARIHVGRSRHRPGVTQVFGHRVQCRIDRPGAAALGAGHTASGPLSEDHRGEHRRVPGAQIFGAELGTGQLLEPSIDVRGAHVVPTLLGPVGQQVVPAATAPEQRTHDRVQGRVPQSDCLVDATLGRVPQLDAVASKPHVLAAHSSQTEAALVHVGAGRVLVAADPERADVQHPQGRGQHPIAAQPATVELLADLRPHRGQPPAQP